MNIELTIDELDDLLNRSSRNRGVMVTSVISKLERLRRDEIAKLIKNKRGFLNLLAQEYSDKIKNIAASRCECPISQINEVRAVISIYDNQACKLKQEIDRLADKL